MPDVSIIIPLHNSHEYMHNSINSALGQSFSNFELILVDDGSTDETLALARQYELGDQRVRVIALPTNKGSGRARNAGIDAAAGRYIAFLDSDDQWEPEKLSTQLATMAEKNCALSYTDYSAHTLDGTEVYIFRAPEIITYPSMLKTPSIGCSTAIYDSLLLGKCYFPHIRKRQDFALWLSILRNVGTAHKCGNVLTRYALRPGSVSSNKFLAAKFTWCIYREFENMNLFHSAYNFSHYIYSNIKRRLTARMTNAFSRVRCSSSPEHVSDDCT